MQRTSEGFLYSPIIFRRKSYGETRIVKRVYICDLCGAQMEFDDVKFPTELEQHWGSLDYLGERVDICPKCMVKLLYGEKVKDLCQLLLGRGKKIEEN